jgi:thiol-disulfide isomerase/thioredoxin
LKGYPVVVNMWASWCGPCRAEFPAYQRVAVTYGKQVAFFGLNINDHDAAATGFLRQFPVTYPSYVDPQGATASDLKAYKAYPQTFYFDRGGKMIYDHAGPYADAKALEADVRRYALESK